VSGQVKYPTLGEYVSPNVDTHPQEIKGGITGPILHITTVILKKITVYPEREKDSWRV
jgi:hypothetical protein